MSMFLRRFFIGLLCLVLYSGAGWLPLAGSGGGGGGCSQATTFLARTSGLSGTETTAYTTMICGMVTDGTWTLFDGLYVLATNNTTTAALNLVSTSFSLTSHGSCTFNADRGYTGDGSSCYFDTGFNPRGAFGNMTQNSAHIAACVLTSRTSAAGYIETGVDSNGIYSYIEPWFTGSGNVFGADLNGSTFTQQTNPTSNAQGNWLVSRTSSSAIVLYHNGSSFATVTDASGQMPSANILLFNYDTGQSAWSADQIAIANFGAGLTSGQASSVYSRENAFLTAVGASGC